jgi:hypothetical protein
MQTPATDVASPAPSTTPHTDAAIAAREARRQQLLADYARIRGRYSEEQRIAIVTLYTAARTMLDTGGGSRCAKLLLGLYNGTRFPFDLTDLRCLDGNLFRAAFTVLQMDARHTCCEVHVLLDAIYADGRSTGAEFEHWAHALRLKGRCKKDYLSGSYGPKWAGVQ